MKRQNNCLIKKKILLKLLKNGLSKIKSDEDVKIPISQKNEINNIIEYSRSIIIYYKSNLNRGEISSVHAYLSDRITIHLLKNNIINILTTLINKIESLQSNS